jgi:hypothetical protein
MPEQPDFHEEALHVIPYLHVSGVRESLRVLKRELAAAYERGRREAAEGWEREWGSRWTPPGCEPSDNVEIAYDEAEARRNADEWLNHRAVSRLVGPWEPAPEQPGDDHA